MVRFEWDYQSMGRFLRTSPELQQATLALAEDLAQHARQTAPVGPMRRGSQPPGEFRDSIHAEPHKTSHDEVGARVVASPPWVEFGRRHHRRYEGSHVLGNTGRAASRPRRTA